MTKTPQMRCKEFDLGRRLEEIIREGIEAGSTWAEIGTSMGVSRLTARKWADWLGIEVDTKRTVRFREDPAVAG